MKLFHVKHIFEGEQRNAKRLTNNMYTSKDFIILSQHQHRMS